MGHRSIPGFCERCGQRFELEQPEPGERELGLDRIKTAFRYCHGCRQYVGRTCCWNPDGVACTVCAPPHALSTALEPDAVPAEEWTVETARRGLAELAASVEAVQHVGSFLGPEPADAQDGEVDRRAWEDAWWATGWLIARAETSRDTAAKALWRVAAQPDGGATDELTGELVGLLESYREARAGMEQRLATSGQRIAGRPVRLPAAARVRRFRPVLVGAGAIAAVVLLAVGAAALTGNGLRPPSSSDVAGATEPNGGVLGGVGGPGQSAAPTASPAPTPTPPPEVLATIDFDQLRVGMLAGASPGIAPVAGAPEVVAFPSPFDRSVRLAGGERHQFCVPVLTLGGGRISFDVDLYAEAPIRSGWLELSVAPANADPTAASVPLELLGGFEAEQWHRLRVAWAPGQQAVVAIGDASREEVRTLSLPLATDPDAALGAVCVSAAGMTPSAELLLDNLRVEQ